MCSAVTFTAVSDVFTAVS
ncbi:hypothetical protein A2U01_0114429, partial [Trifolium medium]|nr:hypothetical protein [Trifolium medium]